jgi:L-alanine-DL-glutamate epimerase-like enolase superfamily enzyme
MVHQMLFDRLPPDRLRLEAGELVLPETPGIGVDLDASTLAAVSP